MYLGTLTMADAGAPADDAGPRADDAGREGDGDDDALSCNDDQVCPEGKAPYCHPQREVCVECLRDEHCPEREHCEDDGDCDD